MTYLDMVHQETLRKYPVRPLLIRKSVTGYTFNNTKVTIPEKTLIWIPLYALHRDEKIYPNPDAFIPERFTDEAVATRHPMDYLPFGDGPRNCIGARFAVYQSKGGLITILCKYKVEVCDKTMIPYVMDKAALLGGPEGEAYLKFEIL